MATLQTSDDRARVFTQALAGFARANWTGQDTLTARNAYLTGLAQLVGSDGRIQFGEYRNGQRVGNGGRADVSFNRIDPDALQRQLALSTERAYTPLELSNELAAFYRLNAANREALGRAVTAHFSGSPVAAAVASAATQPRPDSMSVDNVTTLLMRQFDTQVGMLLPADTKPQGKPDGIINAADGHPNVNVNLKALKEGVQAQVRALASHFGGGDSIIDGREGEAFGQHMQRVLPQMLTPFSPPAGQPLTNDFLLREFGARLGAGLPAGTIPLGTDPAATTVNTSPAPAPTAPSPSSAPAPKPAASPSLPSTAGDTARKAPIINQADLARIIPNYAVYTAIRDLSPPGASNPHGLMTNAPAADIIERFIHQDTRTVSNSDRDTRKNDHRLSTNEMTAFLGILQENGPRAREMITALAQAGIVPMNLVPSAPATATVPTAAAVAAPNTEARPDLGGTGVRPPQSMPKLTEPLSLSGALKVGTFEADSVRGYRYVEPDEAARRRAAGDTRLDLPLSLQQHLPPAIPDLQVDATRLTGGDTGNLVPNDPAGPASGPQRGGRT